MVAADVLPELNPLEEEEEGAAEEADVIVAAAEQAVVTTAAAPGIVRAFMRTLPLTRRSCAVSLEISLVQDDDSELETEPMGLLRQLVSSVLVEEWVSDDCGLAFPADSRSSWAWSHRPFRSMTAAATAAVAAAVALGAASAGAAGASGI